MKIQGETFLLFIAVVLNKFDLCVSTNLQSFFRLELEDKAVDKNIKPILNESTSNEIECYMKCLDNQGKCCLLQMKEELDKVSCLLYNVKLRNASFHSEVNSKISSVEGCKSLEKDNESSEENKESLEKDCKSLYEKGHRKDGVYEILINGTTTKVFCDMTTDGGGWTIFQRRIDGSVDFKRTWDEYKNGFGHAENEYWLGNDLIHQLTKGRSDTLIRIEAEDFGGVRKHITMKGFWIEDESSKYRLHAGTAIDGKQGLVDDWLTRHDNQYFSTKDQDNDTSSEHCGRMWHGGWWYEKCFSLSPNGKYYPNSGHVPHATGIHWYSWTGYYKSLKSIKMQFK